MPAIGRWEHSIHTAWLRPSRIVEPEMIDAVFIEIYGDERQRPVSPL